MSHKDIIKKFGEGVLLDASLLLEEERQVIPFTPLIDCHLGGGLREGTIVSISGPSGSGKSTMALTFSATAQKKEYGSRHIIYDDVEHRLAKSNLEGISGLDCSKEKFTIIRSVEDKILSAEDHLNIMVSLLKEIKKGVFIIDSSSALCGLAELTDDIRGDFRSNSAKLLANFCRHIAPIVLLNKSIVIITQHLIEDTSGKGMGAKEDGGRKLLHAAEIRLRIKYTEKWTVGSGENERRVGQILNCGIIKGPFGPVDGLKSYLRYGKGIDKVQEILITACDLGLISKAGAWFELSFLEKPIKLQGQEKVYNHLVENTEDYVTLQNKVQELLS